MGSRFARWVVIPLGSALLAGALSLAHAQPGPSTVAAEHIFSALGLQPGQTVGEIGAGNGALTIAAARLVGATGHVYTSELGVNRLRTLAAAVQKSGLGQITVVTGDPNGTNFPESCCDAIFMRNVYHHFADPAAMNASIFRALKPGGRVAIVDFEPSRGRPEAASPGDRADNDSHGVSPASVTRELQAAGFEIVANDAAANRWFMVVGVRDGRVHAFVSSPRSGTPASGLTYTTRPSTIVAATPPRNVQP